jgi:DNA-binding PadR family transcriptional regulator
MKLPSKTERALLDALGGRERSGRDLAKQYEKESGKSISYGTLYTTMARLKDSGWVDSREDINGDRRVRLFKITGQGQSALSHIRAWESDVGGLAWEGGVA